MRKSRFSDERVIGFLKEHQAALSAVELCRRRVISDARSYKWGSRFGGMEVSERSGCDFLRPSGSSRPSTASRGNAWR